MWVAYNPQGKILGKCKLRHQAVKLSQDAHKQLFQTKVDLAEEDKSPVIGFTKYFIELESNGKI